VALLDRRAYILAIGVLLSSSTSSLLAAQPPREGCRGVSEIEYNSAKNEYLLISRFRAVDGFFLTHYDFLAPLEESAKIPPGPTGLQALPDMLVRLSRVPVVSIASIRGRATGVGSELALASDMRLSVT
jgi:hypothetical protein